MNDATCGTASRPPARRILVVEDTPELLELLTIVLNSGGYIVLQATNGREALELARRELPDIILADVEMPEMDGMELLRRAREDARLLGRPIVALTACAMQGDRERLLDAGFTGYVSKPIRPHELLPQIERYLARR